MTSPSMAIVAVQPRGHPRPIQRHLGFRRIAVSEIEAPVLPCSKAGIKWVSGGAKRQCVPSSVTEMIIGGSGCPAAGCRTPGAEPPDQPGGWASELKLSKPALHLQ